MMSQRTTSVTLLALSCVVALLSESALASSTSGSTMSLGCIPGFFADGDCDLQNDNEDCDYDGGDCCECTCVSTEQFVCGENGGFACLDPSAPCVDDDDVTTLPTTETSGTTTNGCIEVFIADAFCDNSNNNEECDYDGGDCCECTCVSNADYTCGDLDNGGFDCADPNAPCFDDDVSPGFSYDMSVSFNFAQCDGIEAFIRDGDCDSVNNNEECDFDGGDCCECTCGDNLDFECGFFNPFECVDPEAPCVNDDVGASIVGEDSRDFSCEEYPKNC